MWLHTATVYRRAMAQRIFIGETVDVPPRGTQRIALPNADEVS
jgi:hypothetical protein